jgi:hypothetical protein
LKNNKQQQGYLKKLGFGRETHVQDEPEWIKMLIGDDAQERQ